jgi:hypothetical protein
LLLCAAVWLRSPSAQASEAVPPAAVDNPKHGPNADLRAFPSHQFQLAPRWHDSPQLSVHLGLLQPILMEGFNAALDLRWGPMLFSYSHGQGLNYSASGGAGLSRAEADAGLQLRSPWTTGGGIGVILIDEAWVMVDVKRHRYEAQLGSDTATYSTTSIGGELGWRYFVWRGFFAQTVVRFWPNVHTSLPNDQVRLGRYEHHAKNLGLFANVMAGWAFDI